MPAWFDELAPFLRIASVSADPAHAADVRSAGTWVCDFIRAAGGEAELVDYAGQPLAIGELRASRDSDSARTVLCYGHFDVQPPDPLDLWESEPFEPTIRGDHVYARGVADDKGQLYLMLAAARDLAAAGELPVNVRFTCDGEEETGGQSILGYLADGVGGGRVPDAAVIFDSEMIGPGTPQFNLATRGMAYFHITVRTGARDLHSGSFGGAALNAAHVLSTIIGAVVAGPDGRVPEPLRAGIIAPTAEELASWSELPAGADELRAAGATPMDADAVRDYYVRTTSETTVEVNGFASGSPVLEKTVLPVGAEANISMRLAPGQRPEPVVEAFRALVAEATPAGAVVELQLMSTALPGIVDPDSRVIQLGLDAFERALGVRPLLTRTGGTLPIVSALSDLGIPAIITGFSLPDAQVHSPNENMLVENIELGLATARQLFLELASL